MAPPPSTDELWDRQLAGADYAGGEAYRPFVSPEVVASAVARQQAAAPAAPAPLSGGGQNWFTPDGRKLWVPVEDSRLAAGQGWRPESLEEIAASQRSTIDNLAYGAGAFSSAALDTASFGATDAVAKGLMGKADAEAYDRLRNEYAGASYAGAAAGLVLPMLVSGGTAAAAKGAQGATAAGRAASAVSGGLVLDTARAAGTATEKGLLKLFGAEAISELGVGARTVLGAAKMGAEGAVLGAPSAAAYTGIGLARAAGYVPTEQGQSVANDMAHAGEALLFGALGGAALGAGGGFGSALGSRAREAFGGVDRNVMSSVFSSKLGDAAEKLKLDQAIAQFQMLKKETRQLFDHHKAATVFDTLDRWGLKTGGKRFSESWEEAAARIDGVRSQAGERIGALTERADELAGRKGVGTLGELVDRLERAGNSGIEAGTAKGAGYEQARAELRKHLDSVVDNMSGVTKAREAGTTLSGEQISKMRERAMSRPVSFREAHDTRINLDARARFDKRTPAANGAEDAFKRARTEMTDAFTEAGDRISPEAEGAFSSKWRQANTDYSVLKTIADSQLDNVDRFGSNMRTGLPAKVVGASAMPIGAGIGGALGGAPGAIVGAGAANWLASRADQAVRFHAPMAIVSTIEKLQNAGWLARSAETMGAGIAEAPLHLDRLGSAPAAVSGTPREAALRTIGAFLSQIGHEPANGNGASIGDVADAIRNAAGDPSAVATLQRRETDAGVPPEQAASYASTVQRATQYLASVAPAVPKRDPLGPAVKGREPTRADADAFQRSLEVVADPFSVYQRLSNGTLSSQDVATLRAVYPRTASAIQAEVTKKLASLKASVPAAFRAQVAMLAGADPQAARNAPIFQNAYASAKNHEPIRSTAKPFSQAKPSTVQRITG